MCKTLLGPFVIFQSNTFPSGLDFRQEHETGHRNVVDSWSTVLMQSKRSKSYQICAKKPKKKQPCINILCVPLIYKAFRLISGNVLYIAQISQLSRIFSFSYLEPLFYFFCKSCLFKFDSLNSLSAQPCLKMLVSTPWMSPPHVEVSIKDISSLSSLSLELCKCFSPKTSEVY